MKYMGSKNRIAKFIKPLIIKNKYFNQYYVEPFAGGMNMMDKISGRRIANDKNIYLIEMWKLLTSGKDIIFTEDIPKSMYDKARTEYNNKTNIEFSNAEIGWIGWMGSFNGRFFDGGYSGKTETRDYISEQIKNVKKQIPLLQKVDFISGTYDELEIPKKSIIYCDPPYKNTKQYAISKDFNHDKFWDWVRIQVKLKHEVFISEYQSPDDFITIWEKEITNSMNTTKTTKPIEKLFIYKSQKQTHKFFKINEHSR